MKYKTASTTDSTEASRRHHHNCECNTTVLHGCYPCWGCKCFTKTKTLWWKSLAKVHSYYACWPFLILTHIYIVIHMDIVHLSQFLKFFQVKRHWYWYWYDTFNFYVSYTLLSLNFMSHFERFTKEIFTLLSWTTNLYGSYNIHH